MPAPHPPEFRRRAVERWEGVANPSTYSLPNRRWRASAFLSHPLSRVQVAEMSGSCGKMQEDAEVLTADEAAQLVRVSTKTIPNASQRDLTVPAASRARSAPRRGAAGEAFRLDLSRHDGA